MGFAQPRFRKLGLRTEATEGTLDTAGTYTPVYVDNYVPSFVDGTIGDPRQAGTGESQGEQTVLTAFDMQTPAALAYSDARPLIARQLRGVFPAEVTIVGTSDINMLTGATHNDGTTGWQITAPTGDLDTLIQYDGATVSGAEGLMMSNSGWTEAANNRWRRIKDVWDDGTAKLDIEPGWVGVATGAASWAGAPTADTLDSPTIKVGTAIRNRHTGAGVVAVSAIIQQTDLSTNGVWTGGTGLVANNMVFNYAADKGVGIDVSWIGWAAAVLQDSDPSSQGFAALTTPYQRLDAGNHLTLFAVVTQTKPTVLSSYNINGCSFTVNGGCAGVDDIGGLTTRAGVNRGDHSVTGGTIDWKYRDDDQRCVELAQLGDAATNETGEVVQIYTDAAGNIVIPSVLKCDFGQTGPIAEGGQLTFRGKPKTATSRTVVWQEFAA